MKKIVVPVFLVALACSICTGGCVRYYKSSDIRKTFKKAKAQTGVALLKAKRAVQEAKTALESLKGMKPDLPAEKLSGLERMLAGIESGILPIEQGSAELQKLAERFEAAARGKSKIRSDRPEWDQVQKIKADMEALNQRLKKDFKRLNKKLKAFEKALNKAGKGQA